MAFSFNFSHCSAAIISLHIKWWSLWQSADIVTVTTLNAQLDSRTRHNDWHKFHICIVIQFSLRRICAFGAISNRKRKICTQPTIIILSFLTAIILLQHNRFELFWERKKSVVFLMLWFIKVTKWCIPFIYVHSFGYGKHGNWFISKEIHRFNFVHRFEFISSFQLYSQSHFKFRQIDSLSDTLIEWKGWKITRIYKNHSEDSRFRLKKGSNTF